ncbi:MAG: glycosyltransferase [Litorimonas sp.]
MEAVGGWDAFNVTEDADLSFRLAAQGHKIGYIIPPTEEEAVSSLGAWRLQRARWIKGYIQTWDVHMTQPFAPGGIKGILRFLTLQLTLGITLLSVLFYTPVVLGLPIVATILWWVDIPLDIGLTYSLTFFFSVLVGCLIGVSGACRANKPSLIRSAISMPFYWLILFTPALRAFAELKNNRFHWHKTRHGVSRPADLTHIPETKQDYVPFRRSAD